MSIGLQKVHFLKEINLAQIENKIMFIYTKQKRRELILIIIYDNIFMSTVSCQKVYHLIGYS